MPMPIARNTRVELDAYSGQFAGYASRFGQRDAGGDIVEKGAFANALAIRPLSQIAMLFQHDPSEVIGCWDRIEERADGLFVLGTLNQEVARAREVLALLVQGAMGGLSIGYHTIAARQGAAKARRGDRHLTQLDLWEISLVTFPMLPTARVTWLDRSAPESVPKTVPKTGMETAPRAAQSRSATAHHLKRAARALTLGGHHV